MLKYLTLQGWLTSAVVLTHTWCLRVLHSISLSWASLVAQLVKNPLAMQEIPVQFLDQEDPLEKGMTTLSSVLTWRIPWTEEPGRLQSMGLQRVRHNWVNITSLPFPSLFTVPKQGITQRLGKGRLANYCFDSYSILENSKAAIFVMCKLSEARSRCACHKLQKTEG